MTDKIVYYCNLLFLVATVATVCINMKTGLMFMLILGTLQLICALTHTLTAFKKRNVRLKTLLTNYWIFVVAFIVLTQLLNNASNKYACHIVFAIPLAIAGYLVYLTYVIQKEKS